ncbi:hypothetical protein Bca4012_103409 [Brassica carinata]
MLNVYIRVGTSWPAWKGGSSERYGLTSQCLVQHEARSDGLTVRSHFPAAFRQLFRWTILPLTPNFRFCGLGLVSSVFQLII